MIPPGRCLQVSVYVLHIIVHPEQKKPSLNAKHMRLVVVLHNLLID